MSSYARQSMYPGGARASMAPQGTTVPGPTMAEQMSQIDQAITLTLQEIDENFAKSHQIITNQILPAVKRYGESSYRISHATRVSVPLPPQRGRNARLNPTSRSSGGTFSRQRRRSHSTSLLRTRRASTALSHPPSYLLLRVVSSSGRRPAASWTRAATWTTRSQMILSTRACAMRARARRRGPTMMQGSPGGRTWSRRSSAQSARCPAEERRTRLRRRARLEGSRKASRSLQWLILTTARRTLRRHRRFPVGRDRCAIRCYAAKCKPRPSRVGLLTSARPR